MDLSILEILYIFLIFFTVIIWTLLSIVLYKLIKVLNVFIEVVDLYNKFRQIFLLYSQIPDLILNYVKEKIFSKNK